MCGIAGKLTIGRTPNNQDINTVQNIRDTMIHRGPNGYGLISKDNVIFAHRRLAIIDLSTDANQPMISVDGRYMLTYNGEVYNYLEIKKNLKKKGYLFKTKSDTEVVLNAFIEYGEKCLSMFNGMFAIAIWDSRNRTLFLARDRFGKKPLYFSQNNDSFTFASEIKALKKDKGISQKISLEALNCYLALGYIINPLTMYNEIYSLEPATFLFIDFQGRVIKKSKYWDYSNCFRHKTMDNEKDIKSNIIHLLSNAVQHRMISDVPVGAFLSGGIDSSSIVAILKKIKKDALHTFSVGFNSKSYNELEDADRVGNYLNTIHHGIVIDNKQGLSEILSDIIDVSDQLFSDNSIIPMIEVSKLASKYVTVVLSGDGADELFAGYITYSADKYYEKTKNLPYFLKKMLSSQKINFLPSSNKKINFDYKRKQFFKGTLNDYQKAHYSWRLIFTEEERISLLGEKNKELVKESDPFLYFKKYYDLVPDLDRLDQHLYVDSQTWLADDILPKVDRSTMFSSIEARAPYLDVDLVTYVASIDSKLKLRNGEKKSILKSSLIDTIPSFVIKKKKSGFNAPIHEWIDMNEYDEFRGYTKFIYNRFFGHE